MTARFTSRVAAAVAFTTLAACSTSESTGPGVFDIPDVVLHPSTAACANNLSGSYTVDFAIHLVNTTSKDVTVTKVGTQAVITSSTVSAGEVGQGALLFSSLSLQPPTVIVPAKTGDITADAFMTAPCTPTPPGGGTRKYSVALQVTTAAGQQSVGPYALTVNWSSF